MSFWSPYLNKVFCVASGLLVAGSFAPAAEQTNSAVSSQVSPNAVVMQKGRVNRLLLLEERITRALKGLSSGQDATPIPVRTAPPIVRHATPSRAAAEESAAKRNWMLMDPDDFAEHEASLELRKLLKDGGFLKDPALSGDEQLFRDLSRQGFGTRSMVEDSNVRDLEKMWGQKEETPADVARTEENLRNMLQERRPVFLSRGEVGSVGESSLSGLLSVPEDLKARREENSYVDDYRNLMNPAPPVRSPDFASSPLGNVALDPLRPNSAVPGMEAPGGARESILGPQFGNINPVLTPRAPMDQNQRVLNQWNKYYTPPSIPERPRNNAPPRPTFEAPRRAF